MLDTLSSQVLVLPINKCVFSAGYKNKVYLNQQGYNHYGVDLFSSNGDLTVYACGDGEVVACGWDGVQGNDKCGNVIAIVYKNVYMINDIYNAKGTLIAKKGDIIDVTCRMFHFSQILCKKGDKVDKNTVIGKYGNTGSATVNGKPMGYHLHIEFDTDTKWPTLAAGIRVGGNVFNRTEDVKLAGGITDSTINPSLIWSLDYNQSIWGKYPGWFTNEDVNLQKYSDIVKEDNNVNQPSEPMFDGIDVSVYQGTINWKKVKESGVDFAFVRLGWTLFEGGLELDKNFKTNITGAINAGIDVGVYVYAYDKTPEAAKISAGKVLEAIKPYKLTYPIAYDIEEVKLCGYTTNTKEYNNSIVDSFMSVIESNKYYAMLYTYTSFALSYLDMSKLKKYDLWIADYRSKEKLDSQLKHPYGIWQYVGDNGKCDGVITACDRNYGYKNYAKIIKNAGLNHLDDLIDKPQEPEKPEEPTYSEQIEELKLKIEQYKVDIENLNEEKNKLIKSLTQEKSKTKDLESKISDIKSKFREIINSL